MLILLIELKKKESKRSCYLTIHTFSLITRQQIASNGGNCSKTTNNDPKTKPVTDI